MAHVYFCRTERTVKQSEEPDTYNGNTSDTFFARDQLTTTLSERTPAGNTEV
jgi:hypothetical protein